MGQAYTELSLSHLSYGISFHGTVTVGSHRSTVISSCEYDGGPNGSSSGSMGVGFWYSSHEVHSLLSVCIPRPQLSHSYTPAWAQCTHTSWHGELMVLPHSHVLLCWLGLVTTFISFVVVL